LIVDISGDQALIIVHNLEMTRYHQSINTYIVVHSQIIRRRAEEGMILVCADSEGQVSVGIEEDRDVQGLIED
jgi:hypothetical protein